MITINLLPPEHREAPPTSTGRMLSIIVSILIVIIPLIFYGITHYVDLPKMQTALSETKIELAKWQRKQIPKRHTEIYRLSATLKKREKTVDNIRLLKTEMARKMTEFYEIIDGHGHVWAGGLNIKKQEKRAARRQVRRGAIQPKKTINVPEYQWLYKVRTAGDDLQTAINYYRQIRSHDQFWNDFVGIQTPEYEKFSIDVDGIKAFEGYEFDIKMTMKMDRSNDE